VSRNQKAAPVTLSEENGVRYLHFGTEWIQGGMRLSRPFALELEYQQQMMALGLFLPDPHRVVQLGLGAGALTKFCWRHVASASIVVVELSTTVIDAARAWFSLPPDGARLAVVNADAREFISRPSERRQADWLQVDLYDEHALGPVYDDVTFYRACRRSLRSPGVASFNLFGASFDPSFAAIADAFDDRVLVLPEVDAGNRIVLALEGPPLDVSFAALGRRARELEARWALNASAWVDGLRSENAFDARFAV